MENKIKGGKADKMSLEDIARKHSVFFGTIQKELEMGLKVEREHTTDPEKAKEIAMDHLSEFPDYYTRLDSMEKKAKKTKEPKECTDAGASGSFEAPAFGGAIMKRDIHKLHNFNKINEVADSGISAGAMYDAPIKKDPMKIDNPGKSTGTIAGNKKMDGKTIAVKKKNFPKFGGPDGKFVSIDPATTTFPYRNQGDPKNTKLYEIKGMKKAVEEASKKYGVSIKEIEEMIMKESKQISEALPVGMWDDANSKAIKGWVDKGEPTIHHLVTDQPLNIKIKDDVELAKLKMILYKHDVNFKVTEFKK